MDGAAGNDFASKDNIQENSGSQFRRNSPGPDWTHENESPGLEANSKAACEMTTAAQRIYLRQSKHTPIMRQPQNKWNDQKALKTLIASEDHDDDHKAYN